SSRRRHTRFSRDWSSDVCSSDLLVPFLCVPITFVDTYVMGDVFFNMCISEILGIESCIDVKEQSIRAYVFVIKGFGDHLELHFRSEERRVGKEYRYRRSRYHYRE